jgi:polar amino acid transport system substrate-binding protein
MIYQILVPMIPAASLMLPVRLAVVAMLLLLGTVEQAAAGATLERVHRTGVVNDVLLDSYPPFGFINEHNELAGFDVDVARAFAHRLGVKLQLQTPAWEAIVSGRWQGRWDICICSMSPTSERTQVLNFPAIYYESPAVLTVHRDERNIKTAADLSGKRVGVGIGSSYEKYLHRELVIPGAPAVAYPFHDAVVIPGDESINFRNLALGPGVRLDAIVSDLATARTVTTASRVLKIVGPVLYAEPNAVATEKGDADWDRTVARIFDDLRRDGTLAQISQKWFGTDITANDH